MSSTGKVKTDQRCSSARTAKQDCDRGAESAAARVLSCSQERRNQERRAKKSPLRPHLPKTSLPLTRRPGISRSAGPGKRSAAVPAKQKKQKTRSSNRSPPIRRTPPLSPQFQCRFGERGRLPRLSEIERRRLPADRRWQESPDRVLIVLALAAICYLATRGLATPAEPQLRSL